MNLNISSMQFFNLVEIGKKSIWNFCSNPKYKVDLVDKIRGLIEEIQVFEDTCQLLKWNMSACYNFKDHNFTYNLNSTQRFDQDSASRDRIIYLIRQLALEWGISAESAEPVECYLISKFLRPNSERILNLTVDLAQGKESLQDLLNQIEMEPFPPLVVEEAVGLMPSEGSSYSEQTRPLRAGCFKTEEWAECKARPDSHSQALRLGCSPAAHPSSAVAKAIPSSSASGCERKSFNSCLYAFLDKIKKFFVLLARLLAKLWQKMADLIFSV